MQILKYLINGYNNKTDILQYGVQLNNLNC